ncbi:hypothetical protein SEUCBS139899_010191 [Sporothrix eucalyptigena]|uniref:EthD domain-containing protein n=1 Tax=Sporothrix eucalyptigena TaxID=1812306 RepID=A0ABP0AZT8_9PEZI
MSPCPYMLWVNSQPTTVDDATWVKMYTTEHVADMVSTRTVDRASYYRAVRAPVGPLPAPSEYHPLNYVAVYQTDYEDCVRHPLYGGIRHHSTLLPPPGRIDRNGDFHARNYKMVQDYDPEAVGKNGEKPPPFILTVEIGPKDEAAYTKWVEDEHLPLVHKITGHRRSQRYVIGPPITDGKDPKDHDLSSVGKHFIIHEFDSLKPLLENDASAQEAFGSEGAKAAFANSSVTVLRMWELVKPVGW